MKQVTERLYKYNPSGYCGVFMPEKVMKKLAKLTNEFEIEVKRILLDNVDDLYAYDWSIANIDGKQVTIQFANKDDLERRINLFKARQPEYCPVVYLGNPYSPEGKEFLKSLESEVDNGS